MGVSVELMQRVRGRVGAVLNGKWRLDRVLGVGGMAAVYAATHRNQKRVAIKMLHAHFAFDDNVKSRFLREGYAANTVDHPGAVTVFDDDVAEDGSAFIVMELLEGETLDARAERKGLVLPLGEVLALVDRLLDVLVAAHDAGLVHRDLKPENLFLTVDGQLKVLDFGIARLHEATGTDHSTAVGSFMGTPAFMAPEQARGRWDEVDARSDIWAVGATLYTLLTGRNVHEADTVNDQLVFAATQPAPSIATVMPELPESVVRLVDKALMYEKRDRWPDARAMRVALQGCFPDLGNVDMPSAPRVSVVRSAADLSADTLAAPPEVISEISSPSNIETRNVTKATAAVTSSRTPSLPPSGRSRALKIAGVAALAAAIVGVIVIGSRSASEPRVETAEPADSKPPAPQEAAASPATGSADGADSDAAAGVVEEEAVEQLDSAEAQAASSAVTAPRPAPRARPAPRPAPKPTATAPAPKPAPVPAPKPTSNPFDRRF